MEAAASLKQTTTYLFDAIRFGDHAVEMEGSARGVEGDLEAALARLEAQTEEVSHVLSSMDADQDPNLKEFSHQVGRFMGTAKEQTKTKLQRGAKQQLESYRNAISSEKDKALKSLEAYFASDPLPILEQVVQVRLSEGAYEASARYECEGGVKYDFRLAGQNTRAFQEPLALSQLGFELRVPVRFSRGVLSRSRTPGYERLDQYVLADAEMSGGRLRANFEKPGHGAKIKMTTSGDQEGGFLGLEYSDQIHTVNVISDPSLAAFADIDSLKKAAAELVAEMDGLSKRRVALLRLTANGDQPLESANHREILEKVMDIMGPAYRAAVKKLASVPSSGNGDEFDLDYLRGRLKLLGGDLSNSVSQGLGLAVRQ